MIRGVKMYMIVAILVTLMTTTLGLPQTCLHYCNLSSASSSSSIPPGCDCSLHNLRKSHIATPPDIKDTGIHYEPVKLDSSQNTWLDEQTSHMLNFNPNTFSSTILKKHPMTVNTDESFAVKDSYNDNTSKSSNKYKITDSYFPKMLEEIKEFPLHLYLDVGINTSENDNRSQLEELKNMFVNFQTVEKDLSECMNLHIYIFSKDIDTINKTNPNWGRIVEHDNLTRSQKLTEIQSKCDQPDSIIKQSIYQIKQYFSREDQTTEIIQEGQTLYSADSKEDVEEQNATNKYRYDVNTSTTTQTTEATGNVYSAETETTEYVADKTDDAQIHKKYSEQDKLNLFNNDLSGTKIKDFISTSAFYDDPTVFNKIKLAATTDPTAILSDSENLRTTSKTERIILSEEDMKIPRIITKEFSNGTLNSVVDGYETIPNSDFINNNTTTSDKSTLSLTKDSSNESKSNPDLLKSDNDKIVQSHLVNIHGNLYFSFGKKQIPARFIQQSDGKLNVAIDGFSMCDEMLEDNTSNFMNLLCKCIKHQNCT